jgi:hypothetical protein
LNKLLNFDIVNESYICDINYKNEQAYILYYSISVIYFMYPNPRFNLQKDNSEKEMAISFVAKPYRLQTNDVLSINIKAIEISRYFLVLQMRRSY